MAGENFSTFVVATSSAGSLAGTEVVPVISGGVTKKTTAAAIAASGTPKLHSASHKDGGSDAIKLDELAAPSDNTNLNASTSAHGLLPKLDGEFTHFLSGGGNWATVSTGVTSVTAGTGLSGGIITATGTISLADTLVNPGTYGNGNHVPVITIDQQGRITNAGTSEISGGGGGSGTVTSVIAGVGLSGGTITVSGTIDLASTAVFPGTYGSSTSIPVLTIDQQGRITGADTAGITGSAPGGSAGQVQFNGSGVFSGAASIGVGNGTQLGFFDASPTSQQSANSALTDSTGGSASTTLGPCVDPIGTLGALVGSINNNFASIAARLAEIRTLLTAYRLGT